MFYLQRNYAFPYFIIARFFVCCNLLTEINFRVVARKQREFVEEHNSIEAASVPENFYPRVRHALGVQGQVDEHTVVLVAIDGEIIVFPV